MAARKPGGKRAIEGRKAKPRLKRPTPVAAAVVKPKDAPGLILKPPVAVLWSSGDRELKVPTVALTAEILCADGTDMLGRIFVPASAFSHAGATRPEEWMNEPPEFFPFLPDSAPNPIIVNKQEVVILSVSAAVDADLALQESATPKRRVKVVCGGRRVTGDLLIDMPRNQSRVLDYLNRADRFLTLRDGDRHHLIQKQRITRVEEYPEV